ncbi:hypothetical protein MLD38_032669 [Melastoma candidum]|uniref:Uncharacterized protein n=1 Tax=Melastoma candidum TaxID=119954 RepID=A0ACB9M434_9MYRT|nr:hypothetical protein MLD38_032669 [Melastoma candidum]
MQKTVGSDSAPLSPLLVSFRTEVPFKKMAAVARASRRLLAAASPRSRGFATDVSKNIEVPSVSRDRIKWDYRGQRKIIPLGQWLPKVAVDAYVAPNVVLAGQVSVLDGSSVWNGSVLRGDLNKITLGFCSNLQESLLMHLRSGTSFVLCQGCPLIHPSTGSLVETHSILEAGSVLPPGRRVPTGELWAGNPARFVRTLTHEETLEIPKLAVAINDLSRDYFSEFLPYSTVYLEVEKLKKSFGISI